MDYKKAGVDIEAGYQSVELMKQYVAKTMRPEVLGGIGGFSGAFSMEKIKTMDKPVLVSGTDGVGTKIKLAFLLDKLKAYTKDLKEQVEKKDARLQEVGYKEY